MKKRLPSILCFGAALLCSPLNTFAKSNMPEIPADVKAAPEDAEKTSSGLASKVLTKGTGAEHPAAVDTVTVHYSGWTTDGKMFDSSVSRGEPASFPLTGVIKGWTEGVQLMVQGEKTRFWIPSELAYNNQPGKPAGMLVFDIELLSYADEGAAPAAPAGAPPAGAKPATTTPAAAPK